MIVDDGESSSYYNLQLYYFVVRCSLDKHELEIGTRFIFIVFFSSHPIPNSYKQGYSAGWAWHLC
jgi:hypothetical protein